MRLKKLDCWGHYVFPHQLIKVVWHQVKNRQQNGKITIMLPCYFSR